MHQATGRTLAVSLFLLQLAATLFMTGLIWFVQIVHYPLFAAVGERVFVAYARGHATLTGYVVGALSGGLVLLLWLTTGLLQVPLHEHLGKSRDLALLGRLVRSNWIRTAAWSVRSVLLLLCLHRAL